MSKYKSITIRIRPDETSDLPHYFIRADSVVRQFQPKGMGLQTTLLVDIIAEGGKINDAQCQSAVSTVLGAQLNYGITSENVKCHGITWEELLRRG